MRILNRALLWVAWAIPPTALCAAIYIAVIVPFSVGAVPHLSGNFASLAFAAISATALAPVCIIPWVVLARIFPKIESSSATLAIAFATWVCLLGESTTVVIYGEQPAVIHLLPFVLGALAIMSPRFFVRSLSVSGSALATDH
jgi:hypothetical protein